MFHFLGSVSTYLGEVDIFVMYKNPSRFSSNMITSVLPPFYSSQCI